jgi:hypothetical protein
MMKTILIGIQKIMYDDWKQVNHTIPVDLKYISIDDFFFFFYQNNASYYGNYRLLFLILSNLQTILSTKKIEGHT